MSSTLDSEIRFGALVRWQPSISALIQRPETRGAVTAFSIFLGLSIMSAVIFATGYAALWSDTPAIWIHRLMALTVAQSILIAGVTMKLSPLIERNRSSVRIVKNATAERLALLDQPAPPPLPAVQPEPPKPFIGGHLSGRQFLQYHDGTIEIDTLVGRRRFVSIEAAREFVGA